MQKTIRLPSIVFSTRHQGVERIESNIGKVTHAGSFAKSALSSRPALLAVLFILAAAPVVSETALHAEAILTASLSFFAVAAFALSTIWEKVIRKIPSLGLSFKVWQKKQRMRAADQKFWEHAKQDRRVMEELMAAISRHQGA